MKGIVFFFSMIESLTRNFKKKHSRFFFIIFKIIKKKYSNFLMGSLTAKKFPVHQDNPDLNKHIQTETQSLTNTELLFRYTPYMKINLYVPGVSKRALSALSRWRPLTEGFRSMLGYNGGNSADGVPDFVSAETRGLSPGRPVQPLRWGRRRR